MKLAPIILFVYNRLEHTKKTVESLQKNPLAKESEFFVFSDGPKNQSDDRVAETRKYIDTISGFKNITIIKRERNLGLSQSIISGVSEVINKHKKAIVLEDDLVVSKYFLDYMNKALEMYEKEDRVISIHGYIYPTKEKLPDTFFIKGADCWGWATWERGWKLLETDGRKLLSQLEEVGGVNEFDFNGSYKFSQMLKRQVLGQTDSWAIRWYASAFLKNKLTLYPGHSLVQNIGLTGQEGTHSNKANAVYETNLIDQPVNLCPIPTTENIPAKKIIIKYFKSLKPSIWKRFLSKLTKK